MITQELKIRVIEELKNSRGLFSGSDAKFATSIGINSAQYSRVKNGETEGVLSESNWISLARRLGVSLVPRVDWNTAETPVFRFITAQLDFCKENSTGLLLCDMSDIGKTYTAVHYAKRTKNVVYVDCSQVKSKQRLIRQIAKALGVNSSGRYQDVYDDLVYYIKTLANPLIILDEAGDLQYEAFLEIKALYNATQGICGWYMMGADGLKEKIKRSINNKKVGYTEIFSRFSKKYGVVVPLDKDSRENFTRATAAMIIKANAPQGVDVNKMLRGTMGDDNIPSLRRIYIEISKLN